MFSILYNVFCISFDLLSMSYDFLFFCSFTPSHVTLFNSLHLSLRAQRVSSGLLVYVILFLGMAMDMILDSHREVDG